MQRVHRLVGVGVGLSLALLLGASLPTAFAAVPLPENPQSGSAGLQGKVPTPPPKTAATISSPTSGSSFTSLPITVSGLCTSDLLVKVFAYNVFVGSVLCVKGSYSLQVDLFEGGNDVVARIFDALDQPGPDSSAVKVSYSSGGVGRSPADSFTLSSLYARRGANPGETLSWPIGISGGTGPYAISTDWGDGKPATLQSEPLAGTVTIRHAYAAAGTYTVVVKATDKSGRTAFLQLVGQANGAVTQTSAQQAAGDGLVATRTAVVWVPAALAIPLIFMAFWLGRRFELSELRKRLERQDQK